MKTPDNVPSYPVKPDGRGLPGAGSLPDGPRTELGIDQIQADMHRLADRLNAAGATAPSLADVRVVFATGDTEAIASELYRFHVDLITVLTAADFRLGKAYDGSRPGSRAGRDHGSRQRPGDGGRT